MIVEFIGIPGAGKTTLMPVVREYLNEQCFQAYPVLEAARPFASRTFPGKIVALLTPGRIKSFLLWQVFYAFSTAYRARFIREHPALMQAVMDFQKHRPISEYDRKHVLHWFLHLTGSYEFLKAYSQSGDMLIFDEGFVHRVVQLFASENEKPDLVSVADYLELIPRPDVIIFPNASSEVCETRVFERGVWERFQKKESEDTRQFIKNAHRVVMFAIQFIQEKGWTVIEMDNNSQDISASSLALKRSLSEFVIHLPE